jgi:hypothetical protein
VQASFVNAFDYLYYAMVPIELRQEKSRNIKTNLSDETA